MTVEPVATAPLIVAIGGSAAEHSSTERALRRSLDRLDALGARTLLFTGAAIDLPTYGSPAGRDDPRARALVDAMRQADGILIGSPGYHGGVAGLVKNALDYTEDLRGDPRCYFDGLPVGCIATGAGWQGACTTLAALRQIVHALRGWPTPIGVAINTMTPAFDAQGVPVDPAVAANLDLLGDQLHAFLTGGLVRFARAA